MAVPIQPLPPPYIIATIWDRGSTRIAQRLKRRIVLYQNKTATLSHRAFTVRLISSKIWQRSFSRETSENITMSAPAKHAKTRGIYIRTASFPTEGTTSQKYLDELAVGVRLVVRRLTDGIFTITGLTCSLFGSYILASLVDDRPSQWMFCYPVYGQMT